MGCLPPPPQTATILEQLLGKSQLSFPALKRKRQTLGDDSIGLEHKALLLTLGNFIVKVSVCKSYF